MGKKHFSDDKPGRRGPASTGGRSSSSFRPGGDDRRPSSGGPSRPGAGGPGSYGNRGGAPGAGRPERGGYSGGGPSGGRPERGSYSGGGPGAGRPERGGYSGGGPGAGRPERGSYSPARPAFGARPGAGSSREGGFGGPRSTGGAGREEGGYGKPKSYGNSAGRRFDKDERGASSNRGDDNRASRPSSPRDERRGYGDADRGSRDNRRDEQPARPVRPYEPSQSWPGQPYRTEGKTAVPRGESGERNRKFQKQSPFNTDRPAGRPAERETSRDAGFRQPEGGNDQREQGADRPVRAARPFTAKPDFPKEDRREGGFERREGDRREGGFERREERGSFTRRPDAPREGGFSRESREGSFNRSAGEQRRETGGAFGREAGTPGAFGRKAGARPGAGPERPVGSSGPGYFKQLRQQLDETAKASNRFGRADKPKRGEVAGEAPDYKNLKHYEDDKTRGNKRRRDDDDFGTEELRLNRYIANAGICSRREADALIAAGEIRVNGEVVTEMGYKVQPTDTVQYGKTNLSREKQVYVLLNKPKDFITTTEDPEGRRTVMDLIATASKERIFPVGRLDRNTTGLLLFTNDGEVAQKLSHPSHKNKKIYQVELSQPLTQDHLKQIGEGLELEDGKAEVDDVAVVAGNPHFVGIEIHIGRNRIVRRIFEHLGYEIVALDRVQYAGLTKKELPRGKWRFLSEQEVIRLKYFL